jgi:thiamine-monophosphate kinase
MAHNQRGRKVPSATPLASGEDDLIAKYFRPLAKHPGAMGLFDDAAVLTPPEGCDVILTKDAIVGGMHFFADDPAEAIARKALRVNLSDLAAKGATPAGFLLALALPESVSPGWLRDFANALGEDAEAYGCPLLGGDTVKSPGALMVSITALGMLPRGSMVRRTGAVPGDRVFVTGTIGDAALGLMLRKAAAAGRRWRLDRSLAAHLTSRYLLPQPRNALAEAVRTHASAAIDVSDGLVGDLQKLCSASGSRAEVEAVRVPLSAAAQGVLAADPAAMETILTGGDDYEIVCTIPPGRLASFREGAERARVAVTEIGQIVEGEGAFFMAADGRAVAFSRASFSHF